jgi:hypothetical protein|tara:strand:+ start:512 stop:664 length:153 start_codon:yes stop_codon:yes gene_type:complete
MNPYEFVEILKQVEDNKTMIAIVDILLDKVDTVQDEYCGYCQHCQESQAN